MILLPQELDVWYVLPVLRKHLAYILKTEHHLTQKQIAQTLSISESAVSQYMHDKRGQNETQHISEDLNNVFRAAAQQLSKGSTFLEVSQQLLQDKHLIKWKCALHRKKDKNVPDECDVCFQ